MNDRLDKLVAVANQLDTIWDHCNKSWELDKLRRLLLEVVNVLIDAEEDQP